MAQLHEAGLGPDKIKRRVRAGRLHRLHRGIYAVGHRGISQQGQWMAAVLAVGGTAVLSHRSAAALWDLLPRRGGRIDVTVPGNGGRRHRAGIRVHRSSSLEARHATRRWTIPATTPARTLSDLQGSVTPLEMRRARRQAAVLGLSLGPEAEHDATRSELESIFVRLCQRHQLPAPEINVRITGILVDFAWRDRRLIVETDGYRYHRGRLSFENDRARDLHLRSCGFEVIRLTYDQVVRRPDETVSALRRVLAKRA